MKKITETNRLFLRELHPDDAEDFYRLNLNPNVIKYTGNAAFESINEARKFLEDYEDYKRNGYGRWAVMVKESAQFVGWCGLKYDEMENETDIGFRFFEEEWNKGYATESAQACLAYGFETLHLKQIVGRAMKENTASIHVLEKIGLAYEKDIELDGQPAVKYKIESLTHDLNRGQMDKNKETFDTWNKIASVYQNKFMDMDLYNDTYDYICASLDKPKAKLLEIGCGPGNITKYLLSQRPDFDIFGIDIAPNMIELARRNNPTAHFAVMDSRSIHTLDTKYDSIIGGFCLPYLSHAESNKLIADAYHLLHDNGLLYLSFVEGSPEQSDFKTGAAGRVYFNYHDLNDLKTQLIKTNFDDIKIFSVTYKTSETAFELHTVLTAKKKNGL